MITIKTKLRAALEDVKITPNCEFGFIAVTCDDDGFLALWGLDVKDSKQARELCNECLSCELGEWLVTDDEENVDIVGSYQSGLDLPENWDNTVAILTLDQLKSMEQ